jgi:hypothetical protein
LKRKKNSMPAAKKTVHKTAKKTVAKKTVKKKPVRKVAKKSVKKSSTKKSTKVSKKSAKKVTKQTTKKPTKSTRSRKSHAKTKDEVVQLPATPTPELKHKVQATEDLLYWLHTPMYRIAYVAAFCFIIIGLFSLTTNVFFSGQTAAVQCAIDGTCESDTDTSVNKDSNDPKPPNTATFALLEDLPATLKGSVSVPMQIEHATRIEVEFIGLDNGEYYEFVPDKLSARNYQLELKETSFRPGSYQARAVIEDTYSIRRIAIGNVEVEAEVQSEPAKNQEIIDANQTTDKTNDTSVPEESSPAETEESTLEASDKVLPEPEKRTQLDNETVPATEPEGNTETEVATTDNPDNDDVPPSKTVFALKLDNDVWTSREVLRATAPGGHTALEAYVRPVNALEARFLGRMSQQGDIWYVGFDSRNLPNGRYEVFATAMSNNRLITSDSSVVVVENKLPLQDVTLPTMTNQEEMIEDTTASQLVENDNRIPRPFFTVSDDDAVETNPVTRREAEVEVDRLLTTNEDELNDLLQRYAVARQNDDSIMLSAVEEEIENKRKSLVREYILTGEEQSEASQVEVSLNSRLAEIKVRVDAFEDIRRSRLNETVSRDTDKDGISDFDEINVYQTNPDVADSDGDGYIDGAEVARGFNPIDPEPEAIVEYELPTQTIGLARPDVLAVAEVKRVSDQDSNQTERGVLAEIRGTGLPNSYVTLYVFSTPVIVTVKTDADGSFVYRFDKELEDGEHEVFVAFTDNTGSILAQSEPYRFIKEAQAFTPVDAAAQTQPITAPTVVQSSTFNAVQFVLAITIVVLGFFLLMLGVNLRERQPQSLTGSESEPVI